MSNNHSVIVVGNGVAGLMSALRLLDLGYKVKIVSLAPCQASSSMQASGGMNVARDFLQDSALRHAYDTIVEGDFLADQPPVVEMCLAAPAIVSMLEKIGVPWDRTKEGSIAFHCFAGSKYSRSVRCGTVTGQLILQTIDAQIRRFAAQGQVERWEHHEFVRLILDEQGYARGVILLDRRDLRLDIVRADVVVMATGGAGQLFANTTQAPSCSGAAQGRLLRQGMWYANGDCLQLYPTTIPRAETARLLPDSIRCKGGRVWAWGDGQKSITSSSGRFISCGKTKEPWYFLEELYPEQGNRISSQIMAREMLRLEKLGLESYLDVRDLSAEVWKEGELALYEELTGEDPRKVPMKIAPAVHSFLGGAWVDYPAAEDKDRWIRFRHMTSISGCFQVGEAACLYHGVHRLPGNGLLSCLFGALVAAEEIPRYIEEQGGKAASLPSKLFSSALAEEEVYKHEIFTREGKENIVLLYEEMRTIMSQHLAASRTVGDLQKARENIAVLQERLLDSCLEDKGTYYNDTYLQSSRLPAMLDLAAILIQSAIGREGEERKTLLAAYTAQGEISVSYRCVDRRHFPVRRENGFEGVENMPYSMPLPLGGVYGRNS